MSPRMSPRVGASPVLSPRDVPSSPLQAYRSPRAPSPRAISPRRVRSEDVEFGENTGSILELRKSEGASKCDGLPLDQSTSASGAGTVLVVHCAFCSPDTVRTHVVQPYTQSLARNSVSSAAWWSLVIMMEWIAVSVAKIPFHATISHCMVRLERA